MAISENESELPSKGRVLVLDIDETLAHSYVNMQMYNEIIQDPKKYNLVRDQIYHSIIYCESGEKIICFEFWGFFRPYLREMLQKASRHFEAIVIFTAGNRAYANQMTKLLFKGLPLPYAVFASEDLTRTPKGFHKSLTSLIPRLAPLKTDLSKMILVDDRIDNFEEEPANGVLIPPFDVSGPDDPRLREDNALLRLSEWFSSLEFASATDLRKIERPNWTL